MSFSAVIQATLTANGAQFDRTLDNSTTKVGKLEANLRRAGVMPLPGERSAQESAKAIEEIMRAQERLAASRAQRAYEEADTLGRIRVLTAELKTLGEQRARAEEGTAEKLNLQIAAEAKLAQLKSLRVRAQGERVAASGDYAAAVAAGNARSAQATAAAAAAAESAALQRRGADTVGNARARFAAEAAAEESAIMAQIRAREEAPTPGKRSVLQRFTDWRKNAMKSLGDIGGSDVVKGLGVGALVQGFRAVLNNAQEVRNEAYAIGAALDPAVERTAQIADNLDRVREGFLKGGAEILSGLQSVVDFGVASVAGFLGLGSAGENYLAIKKGTVDDANAKKAEARAKTEKRLAEERARAYAELKTAEAEVADARISAAKQAASTEGKIAIVAVEIAEAQKGMAETKANTVERARAELELVNRQAELADLQRQREQEITDEKEKQLAVEEKLAQQREAANKRLGEALAKQQAAMAAVQQAGAAYAAALSDQSSASLSEVTEGKRGSLADRRRAQEVARLRDQARTARDQGRVSLIGGETVSVADQLSTRANEIQSGIQSLNTAERDPLAAVTAQLEQANASLAAINQSLELMEVEE